MSKTSPAEKDKETELNTSGVSKKQFNYQRLSAILQSISVFLAAVGLLVNPLRLGFDVAPILVIVFVLLLLSLAVGAEARSVNWPSRISRLMFQKDIAETVAGEFGETFTHNRLYLNRLRELCLIAISEGKRELAEELWSKGQLVSARDKKSDDR